MSLYLGNEKVKINLGGNTYCLNIFSNIPIINRTRLLSLEGYVLKDINNAYLTVKQQEIINDVELWSSDDYSLMSANDLFLIPKEDN